MSDVGLVAAIRECRGLVWGFEQWIRLAWTDTSLRYRRTVLGPWWVTLSTGAMIGSVGLVWGGIFGAEMSSYLPFFAIGTILWAFISSCLTEGCTVFLQAGGLIKSTPTPLGLHVFRMMTRQVIVLGHNLTLLLLLWAIFQWPVGWSLALSLAGLVNLTIALIGAVFALGVLCTRFRDIQQIIAMILQLLFLLTPIIWMPQSLRGKAISFLMDFNPFYHLIEVVRGPLLGHDPSPVNWLVAIGCALASMSIGLLLYARFRHRVAYWL